MKKVQAQKPKLSKLSKAILGSFTLSILGTQVLSSTVQAQEQATDESYEVINVIGVRAATKEAIDMKKDSSGIVDFLASDDVGKLPDFNIADAIRRAPGVNTIFDEDEGQFVALRGLSADFTYTTFDSGSVAAVDLGGFFGDGRRVLLEAVPSGAVKGVEVIKTLTPELDGNAIGGHVNLVTRSAFDVGDKYFVGTAVLGNFTDQDVSNNDEQLSYRSEATWSDVFGGDDQFGIMVSGFKNFKKRDQQRHLPGIFPTFYDTSSVNDDGFFEITDSGNPNARYFNRVYPDAGYSNEVDRYGVVVKLEHEPSTEFYQSLSINYFQQDENERADQLTLLSFFPGPSETNTNGGLRFENASLGLRSQTWDVEKFVSHFNYRLENHLSDDAQFDFSAVYSEAGYSEVKPRIVIGNISTGGLNTTGGSLVRYSFDNPSPLSNPENFDNASPSGLFDQTDDDSEVTELAGNYKFNLESADDGFGFGFGAKIRSTERNYSLIRESFAAVDGDRPPSSNIILDTTYSPRNSNVAFPLIDIRNFDFDAARAGSNPYLTRTSLQQGADSPEDFALTEHINALYGLVRHNGENYEIIAGVRFEDTDVEATARDSSSGSNQFVTRTSGYSNFLPSITFKYDITDNLVFKTGVSRAIGRPGYSALSGATSTSVGDNGITTITQGNTGLKPRLADNIDVAVDYYFADNDGLISVALFHKDIQDEIFNRTTLFDNGDRLVRPENAESAEVTGLEISVIDTKLDFLPGFLSNFGYTANFTFIDAETSVQENGETRTLGFLVEQPEKIVNVSLFYQQDSFEGRLTYNKTDQFLAFGQPTSDLGWWQAERTFLDAQVSYQLTEGIKIFGEARNLGNEAEESVFGPGVVGSGSGVYVADSSVFGTSYWLGFTYNY